MNVSNETAVVTGAASGIGLALARRLAGKGARVLVTDRDRTSLELVADELGATAVQMDVSQWRDNERLAAMSDAPRVLCLNAGIVGTHTGPVWDTPTDEWTRVMATNLDGMVHGLRAFVPRMLADGEPHGILITSSLSGLLTWPGGGAYAASKHAIITVSEQASISLAETPIQLTVMCPALVRSGMSPEGLDPDVVAVEGLRALDEGRFSVVPEEWSAAVKRRGERLADGLRPVVPVSV